MQAMVISVRHCTGDHHKITVAGHIVEHIPKWQYQRSDSIPKYSCLVLSITTFYSCRLAFHSVINQWDKSLSRPTARAVRYCITGTAFRLSTESVQSSPHRHRAWTIAIQSAFAVMSVSRSSWRSFWARLVTVYVVSISGFMSAIRSKVSLSVRKRGRSRHPQVS
jgi:hypothetical protein